MIDINLLYYLDNIAEDSGITPADKLRLTDNTIMKHLEEKALGNKTSLTDNEFENLCSIRDSWRDNIHEGNEFVKDLTKLGYDKILDKVNKDTDIVKSIKDTKKFKKDK